MDAVLGPGDAGMSHKRSLHSRAYSLQAGESDGPYSGGRAGEPLSNGKQGSDVRHSAF